MSYMLLGTFLVAGSMGALEVDQIGWEQFILQSLIGLAISLYGFRKDKAIMDTEDFEDIVHIPRVRTHGDYCKNPYYN